MNDKSFTYDELSIIQAGYRAGNEGYPSPDSWKRRLKRKQLLVSVLRDIIGDIATLWYIYDSLYLGTIS